MSWLEKLLPPKIQPTDPAERRSVPEGLWVKCPSCETVLYKNDLEANVNVNQAKDGTATGGGKGVATTLGVLIIASWHVGAATCAVWLLIAGIFRYSSLAAIIALAASPFLSGYLANQFVTYLATSLSLLALFRHHENIRRLIRGEENKISQK